MGPVSRPLPQDRAFSPAISRHQWIFAFLLGAQGRFVPTAPDADGLASIPVAVGLMRESRPSIRGDTGGQDFCPVPQWHLVTTGHPCSRKRADYLWFPPPRAFCAHLVEVRVESLPLKTHTLCVARTPRYGNWYSSLPYSFSLQQNYFFIISVSALPKV